MFQVKCYRDLFLFVYCFVDNFLQNKDIPKTKSKFSPSETLCIQIVGELMRMQSQTAIHNLTFEYNDLFQKRISRSSFYKQLNKYAYLFPELMKNIAAQFKQETDIRIIDSMPVPIKHLARAGKGIDLNGHANIGYCAAKKEYYYGMKMHVLTLENGLAEKIELSLASVHDVRIAPNLMKHQKNILGIGDLGYVSKDLKDFCTNQNIDFITAKRKNQKGAKLHNRKYKKILRKRKVIETQFSLMELLNITKMRSRSFWTLKLRVFAKQVAIGICATYNKMIGKQNVLSINIVKFG